MTAPQPEPSAVPATGSASLADPAGPTAAPAGTGDDVLAAPLTFGQATFDGQDPDQVLGSAIALSTPTTCQARTRLYRHGVLELEGFPVGDISEYLKDDSAVIWLDLRDPDREDLAVLSAEFGLHPVAVEDAVHEHERPKLDRYRSLRGPPQCCHWRAGHQRAGRLYHRTSADHRQEGRRIRHRRGRFLLGRQSGPLRGGRRLPAVRPDRQRRRQPFRGCPGA
jgi:hypothetical protein